MDRTRLQALLGSVVVTALAVALIAPAGVAAAGHGKGGAKKAAAQPCKQGGWRNLERSDGTTFRNQGQCVSYAVRGGTLVVPVEPSVTVSYTPTPDPDYCMVQVNLAGLDPSTLYSGVVTIRGTGFPDTPYPVDITTDAAGAASVGVFSYLQGYYDNAANADFAGLSSGYSLIAC